MGSYFPKPPSWLGMEHPFPRTPLNFALRPSGPRHVRGHHAQRCRWIGADDSLLTAADGGQVSTLLRLLDLSAAFDAVRPRSADAATV